MTLKEEEQEAKEGLRKGYLYEGKGRAEGEQCHWEQQ